jgi:hypothetical protein
MTAHDFSAKPNEPLFQGQEACHQTAKTMPILNCFPEAGRMGGELDQTVGWLAESRLGNFKRTFVYAFALSSHYSPKT